MPEANSNEQLKQLKRSVCEIFENQITDENIRQFILGEDGYSMKIATDTSKYIQYIKNVMYLSFYFVYACYKYDMEQGDDRMKNLTKQNAKRVDQSLENAFIRYPVTLDLIQFILTDIQFELSQESDSELDAVFGKVFKPDTYNFDEEKKFSFNPYFKLIAEHDRNPSKFMFNRTVMAELFEHLLKKMSFLHHFSLVCGNFGPDDFLFVRKANPDKEQMNIRHLLFRDDDKYYGGIYHLYSIECKNANTAKEIINLKYFSSAEEYSLLFSIPDAGDGKSDHLKRCDVINETTGQNPETESFDDDSVKNSNVIEQIHTVNYKYIKNLALAISDAISVTDGMKSIIYNRFNRQYPYIFQKTQKSRRRKRAARNTEQSEFLPAYEDKDLNWDTIIIMLLIEASPSVVLEYIIRNNPAILKLIGRNLYKRIFDSENFAVFNEGPEAIKNEVRKFAREKLVVGESAGFGKIPGTDTYEKLFSRAAAMLIISKLTILQESENDDSLVYTGNLRNNIKLLTGLENDASDSKKIKDSCIILGETFKHLICFYSGLMAYGREKDKYDLITYEKCLVNDDVLNFQNDLEDAFIKAAKDEAKEISGIYPAEPSSALVLMDMFIDFCEKNTKTASRHLYAAVGKYEIVNINILKKFREELAAEAQDIYNCDADIWVDITLEILEYLKTGSDSSTEIDSDLFNAIYPFTAVFNRRKENLDGYKTVNFSLNIDVEDDNNVDYHMDINVLSEFTYNRSEVYYCLPNILRSNYKWWIDPVLINFRKFNSIFTDEGNEKN